MVFARMQDYLTADCADFLRGGMRPRRGRIRRPIANMIKAGDKLQSRNKGSTGKVFLRRLYLPQCTLLINPAGPIIRDRYALIGFVIARPVRKRQLPAARRC